MGILLLYHLKFLSSGLAGPDVPSASLAAFYQLTVIHPLSMCLLLLLLGWWRSKPKEAMWMEEAEEASKISISSHLFLASYISCCLPSGSQTFSDWQQGGRSFFLPHTLRICPLLWNWELSSICLKYFHTCLSLEQFPRFISSHSWKVFTWVLLQWDLDLLFLLWWMKRYWWPAAFLCLDYPVALHSTQVYVLFQSFSSTWLF